jgi:hypothetical protein
VVNSNFHRRTTKSEYSVGNELFVNSYESRAIRLVISRISAIITLIGSM